MGSLGTTELLIIFFIVIILFGVGRVSKIGGELGSAVRNFREGLNEGAQEAAAEEAESES
ncbi:MAG: twin-arginine translocase TatA/TatE family subunit [Chloroflexi bacterium]|nr:MAG: twin-arginine translocase TatA/TatE family subunit [Phototrophicales bacterium]RMF77939.1 MAG: twin-arginine translocase TatA/TatE family subunit [Chloroflexota bacterium]